MGELLCYKSKTSENLRTLSEFYKRTFTFAEGSTVKRGLNLKDRSSRCLILQVSQKSKKIPKVLIERSHIQILFASAMVQLFSF